MSLRVGALCAGYGGLELGLQLAGIDTDLIWVAETDKHASAVLDARFGVPNLGDLTQIVDPPEVDIVTAGWPCQPVSIGGSRKGVHDKRWLIRDVVRIATAADARWILMENVRGLLSTNKGEAFGQVLDALADSEFDVRWSCLRADQSVGACHRRDRWFAVAHTRSQRYGGQQITSDLACLDGKDESQTWERQRSWEKPLNRNVDIGFFGQYAPAVQRWADLIGRLPPHPIEDNRLNSSFVEWMMGLETDWVCGLGLPYRQELKLLGNGVMPHQAAVAYGWLLEQWAGVKMGR